MNQNLYAPLIALTWTLVLLLVKRFFFYRFERWAAKTKTTWDDALLRSLRFPVNFLIIASALVVLTALLPLPPQADKIAGILLKASVILAIVLFADRFSMEFIREKSSSSVFGQVSHGFTKGVVRGIIIGIGVLTFLNLIGISITPILASLGIGSLAVALALQDTLSNFFAGLYVAVDKPVREGDFIKIESGDEGYVADLGWRSARIRLLNNNTVIIPNSKLSGSVITNYYLPDKETVIPIPVGVHYASDLNHVERVTLEVAREVMKRVTGAAFNFEPVMRFHTFGESSINATVVLRGKEFTDSFLIKHEFLKALHERYKKEGIVIPYPARTLEFSKETLAAFRPN